MLWIVLGVGLLVAAAVVWSSLASLNHDVRERDHVCEDWLDAHGHCMKCEASDGGDTS